MVWLRWALAALMAAWATLFLLVVAYLGPLISLVLRTQEGVLTPGDSSLGGRLLWLELLGARPSCSAPPPWSVSPSSSTRSSRAAYRDFGPP